MPCKASGNWPGATVSAASAGVPNKANVRAIAALEAKRFMAHDKREHLHHFAVFGNVDLI
jgi:hypothetical protein